MTAHTNHGKTSSAKRYSDRKPKLCEVDHRTLKMTVSTDPVTTTAKVTAELSIYLQGPVSTKKSDKSFPNPSSTAELQLLNFGLLKTMLKCEKDGVMII
jgi:hypothetical protein